MKNNLLQLRIPGPKLQQIIQRRIGELEGEVGELLKREAVLGEDGRRYRGMRDSKGLRRQVSALSIVHDSLEAALVYVVSLTDLVMLDLMDITTDC